MRALLADLADLPIGVGSVVACTQRMSDALAPLATAIQTAIHTTAVVNVDETSWRESGRRAWLWVASSPQCPSFRITTSRGRAGLDALLPAAYGGIVGSDRWNAYTGTRPCNASCAERI
ncbi:MAG: hypothetical protein OHK0050_28980 [Roseiflexaceae bacterium]